MLPKLEYPEHKVTIPSTGKEVKMRPFTVSEEKILLMALDGDSADDIIDATKNLISVCSNNTVDVDELKSFDVEYLFVQLRAKSVSPTVELSYKNTNCPLKKGEADTTCDKDINISISLEDANVCHQDKDGNTKPLDIKDGTSKKVYLTDSIGMELNYPTYNEVIVANDKSETTSDLYHMLCKASICRIWDSETVYTKEEFDQEELDEFYGSLTPSKKEEILKFISSIPALTHEVEYKCPSCDFSTTIKYRGIRDFFG